MEEPVTSNLTHPCLGGHAQPIHRSQRKVLSWNQLGEGSRGEEGTELHKMSVGDQETDWSESGETQATAPHYSVQLRLLGQQRQLKGRSVEQLCWQLDKVCVEAGLEPLTQISVRMVVLERMGEADEAVVGMKRLCLEQYTMAQLDKLNSP